jgi:hypothetical protein
VSLGKRILRGLSLLALDLTGMVMLAVGAASLALGLSLETLAGGSSEAWVNWVRLFASKLGITFLLAGSAAFVVLMFPGWFQFERKGNSDAAEKEIGGWLIFLALSLVALPLAALAVAGPLISLWGEALRVMDALGFWKELKGALGSQFGGLVLAPLFAAALPALLEFAPLLSFGASSVFLLVLFSLRAREFPNVFFAWVLVQVACVLGSFYAVELLALSASFTPALLNELRGEEAQEAAAFAAWIRRHDEIVEPTAIRFAWIFLGYLVWAPALLVSERAKRTFTVEAHSARSRTVAVPSRNSLPARLAEPRFFGAAPPAYDSGAQPDAAQLADGLRYSTFLVQPIFSLKTVLTNPEHKSLAPTDGPGQEVVFYCRTKPGVVNLGFPLRVVTAAGERELFLITKRRISLTSLAYKVWVPRTQETLGIFVRTDFAGALWLLVGGDGRQIGSVTRVAVSAGPERYEAHIDQVPVCHFVWREKLFRGDQVEISFAEESDKTLDKRLGLAFGVLLERHVRSRNYD